MAKKIKTTSVVIAVVLVILIGGGVAYLALSDSSVKASEEKTVPKNPSPVDEIIPENETMKKNNKIRWVNFLKRDVPKLKVEQEKIKTSSPERYEIQKSFFEKLETCSDTDAEQNKNRTVDKEIVNQYRNWSDDYNKSKITKFITEFDNLNREFETLKSSDFKIENFGNLYKKEMFSLTKEEILGVLEQHIYEQYISGKDNSVFVSEKNMRMYIFAKNYLNDFIKLSDHFVDKNFKNEDLVLEKYNDGLFSGENNVVVEKNLTAIKVLLNIYRNIYKLSNLFNSQNIYLKKELTDNSFKSPREVYEMINKVANNFITNPSEKYHIEFNSNNNEIETFVKKYIAKMGLLSIKKEIFNVEFANTLVEILVMRHRNANSTTMLKVNKSIDNYITKKYFKGYWDFNKNKEIIEKVEKELTNIKNKTKNQNLIL